jgi:hypothetical protein
MMRFLNRLWEKYEKGRVARAKREFWKMQPEGEKNKPVFFYRPWVQGPKQQSYKHERDAANLYVKLYREGILVKWFWEPHEEYLEFGLKPDRASVIKIDDKPRIIFWEIDRGTEVHQTIKEKVPKYIELSRRRPENRFNVIFTVPTITRADNILKNDLQPYKRGTQFLVGEYSRVLNDPLDAVYRSPVDTETYLKLADL